MGTLTFKYVRAFTGTGARSLEVYVNGSKIGSTITVSTTSDTVVDYSGEINQSGNVQLEIRSTGAGQVKLDTISWTAYASATAPTVSSSAASSIAATSATLGGNVTADGGATVTERGVVYKTSTGVAITDNKTAAAAGGTGTFSVNVSSLSVNAQYYFKAYAINSAGTTLGDELNFWTLANAPSAPTVGGGTSSSLDVTINENGNPASTEFAIRVGESQYVQADGTVGGSAAWATKSTWGTKTVSGLSAGTEYTFYVKARNGANVETDFSNGASASTSASGAPTQWTYLEQRGTPVYTYYLGDPLAYQFRFAINTDTFGWTVEYGLGLNTSGSGWTWNGGTYSSQDGDNRFWTSDQNEFSFNATGRWYYAGRFTSPGDPSYTYYAAGDWTNNNLTLNATNYFSVEPLGVPTSVAAVTNGAHPATRVDLSWAKWNGKSVLITRGLAAPSASPTNGSAYAANDNLGNHVVLNGSNAGTSLAVDGLLPGTTYYFTFYSENYYYYSTGVTVSVTMGRPQARNTSGGSPQAPATIYLGDSGLTFGLDAWGKLEGNFGAARLWLSFNNASLTSGTASEWSGFTDAENRTRTSGIFNQTGTWYWGMQMDYGAPYGTDFWYKASSASWAELSANGGSSTLSITVSAINNPASPSAVVDTESVTPAIDLSWAKNAQSHNVMVVRKAASASWTEPTQGTAYAAGASLGDGKVIYNGSALLASDATGLSFGTTYNYKLYSVNNDYYSAGVTSAPVMTPACEPAAPTNLGTSDVTQTTFTASWSAPEKATGYRLDVSLNSSFVDIPTTLGVQGFETSPATPTATYSASGGGTISGSSASGDRPASTAYATEGSQAYQINSGTATLTFDAIDASASSSITLSMRLASFSVASTGNGADGTDIVTVFISPDDGANYYSTLRVVGNANAYWSYSATGVAHTSYDGNSSPVDYTPAGGGERTTDGYSTLIVSNLPAVANLRVRVAMVNNSTAERWTLDDVRLTAKSSAFVPGYSNLFVSGTSASVTGLVAETDYYIRVRAENSNGPCVSGNSTTQTVKTLKAPPTAPVSAAATDIGTNSFIAVWNASAGATGYLLDVSTNDVFSTFVSGYQNRAVGNVTTFSVTNLSSVVTYYYRVRGTNEMGESAYSSTQSVTTLAPPPSLTALNVAYTQSFSGYTNAATMPAGWSATSSGNITNYIGTWGVGLDGGFRGNANVLGYQHTGSSSNLVVTLTIKNDTGGVIENLSVGYLGRVERTSETRHPVWTVAVAGAETPDLAYSTANGVDIQKDVIVPGLNIADGALFTITWSSSGDVGSSGNRRQIGIGNVSVAALGTPVISTSGSLAALSTTYGTASGTSSFNVSGVHMRSGITVTPPTGFEVSTSSESGFSSSAITVGEAGTISSTPLYVRLAAGNEVGSYSGNISLSSSGADGVTVATVASTVSAAPLSISGLGAVNKTYDGNTSVSVTGTPVFVGLVLDESYSPTADSPVIWSFADANAGVNKQLTRSGSYNSPSSNYSLTQPSLTATISKKALTITATAQNKIQGNTLPETVTGSDAFTSSGLVSGETIGSVTITYGEARLEGAAAGIYSGQITPSAATGGTFNPDNYSISYVSASLEVTENATEPVVATSSATLVTASGARLSGNISANGGSDVTDRGFVYSSINATPELGGANVTPVNKGIGTGAFTEDLSGLSADTTYYYQAYASNEVGVAYGGVESFKTLKAAPASHATSFASGTVTTNNIPLTWTAASPQPDGYLLRVSSSSLSDPTSGTAVSDDTNLADEAGAINLTGDATSYSGFTGFAAGSTYTFKLYPYNNSGANIAYRTTATVPTLTAKLLPVAPGQPIISSVVADGFTASWDSINGADSYRLDVSTDSEFSSFLAGYSNRTVNDVSQAVSGLSPNTPYWVRVRAFNTSGAGANSSSTNTTTAGLSAPNTLEADQVATDSFRARWNSVTGATGYKVDVVKRTSSATSRLIISQYAETESGTVPKAIELLNVSGTTIDFATQNLVLKIGVNGGAPGTATTVSSGTLAAGAVMVFGTSDVGTYLSNNGAGAVLFVSSAYTFNGDDALVIELGGVVEDVLGNPGSDPGTAWSGNDVSTANQNISLRSGFIDGDTDGWTDPSVRFETISSTPSLAGGLAGFGAAPFSLLEAIETDVVVAGGSTTNYTVSGLLQGTDYGYVVRATSANSTSADSDLRFVKTLSPPPAVTAATVSGQVGVALTSYQIIATGNPTSYAISSGTLPVGLTLNASTGIISGTPTEAVEGRVVAVTATSSSGTSEPANLTFNIAKATQTITFGALSSKRISDGTLSLSATASSGLTVTFASSNEDVATVAGTNVTLVGVGTTTITASQSGNSNYEAATPVARELVVLPAPMAAWDFTGESLGATSQADFLDNKLINSGLLTRGSGATASAGNNSFRTTGFQNNGISTTNTDYFQVSFTPVTGYKLALSSIDARFAGTATFRAAPGVAAQFAYSLDGENFTLIGSSFLLTEDTAMPTIDLSGISALQAIPPGATVTLRYYASGQTTGGGWGFNSPSTGSFGLQIDGSFTAVSVPTVASGTAGSIAANSAIISGNSVTADGGLTILEYGVVYGLSGGPTTNDNKVVSTDGTSDFAASLSGLQAGYTYHVRAFARNAQGVVYGNDITFVTVPGVPSISPAEAIGPHSFLAKWSSVIGATSYRLDVSTNSSFNTVIVDDEDVGTNTDHEVTGLTSEKTYYYRVRAVNSSGTSSDSSWVEVTTTGVVAPPSLSSSTLAGVGATTATLGATITTDGGNGVTAYGVVWNLTGTPDVVADSANVNQVNGTPGSYPFTFTRAVTGLPAAAEIHFRGFATNETGVGYSSVSSFYTEPAANPAGVSYDGVATNTITFTWSSGGLGALVVIRAGAEVTATPTDGTEHAFNAAFGATNTALSSGQFVVYRGDDESVNVTGLIPGTTYHVAIYSYAGSGNKINYRQSSPAKGSRATDVANATVATGNATALTDTTVTLAGNVTSAGGGSILERGVVYGTSDNPTINDGKVPAATASTGSYTVNVTGLTPDTLYYFRAYASNQAGVVYGNSGSFRTAPANALVYYTFAGSSAAPTFSNPGLQLAGNFSISSDTFLFGNANGSSWTAVGAELPYAGGTGGWTANSQTSAKNFFVTLSSPEGKVLTVTNVRAVVRATSNGPSAVTLNIAGTNLNGSVLNLGANTNLIFNAAVAGYSNLAGEVTVRIQGWLNGSRTSSGAGEFHVDNVLVQGSVGDPPPPPIPAVPVALAASATGHVSFVAAWEAAENATSYRLDVARDANFEDPVFVNRMVSGVSYAVTGLDAELTYFYRVRGYNFVGESESSSPVSVTTAALPAPVATRPTYVDRAEFVASWNSVSGASSYLLDVASDTNFDTMVSGYNALEVVELSQFIDDLTQGATYYYRVRAKSATSTSGYSGTIKVALPDSLFVDVPGSGNLGRVTGKDGKAKLLIRGKQGAVYDVYYTDNEGATWIKADTIEATKGNGGGSPGQNSLSLKRDGGITTLNSEESDADEVEVDEGIGPKRYFKVVPTGQDAASNPSPIVGVVKPAIRQGYSMMSPPLHSDRDFAGDFGAELAEGLTANNSSEDADRVMIWSSTGWKILWLNDSPRGWYDMDTGKASTNVLAPGQGFYLYSQSGVGQSRFAGEVDVSGTNRLTMSSQWNLVGLSVGKSVAITNIVFDGTPLAGSNPIRDNYDKFVIDTGDGSFVTVARLISGGTTNWIFRGAGGGVATNVLQPGQGVYYFRGSGQTLDVRF